MRKKETKTLCNIKQKIAFPRGIVKYTQELFLIYFFVENINKHKILSPDNLMEEVQNSVKEQDFI